MLYTTAVQFDRGFELNGFAWVTNCWEICLPYDVSDITGWLRAIKKRWPDTRFITQGEFGMLWREQYKSNDFRYSFEQSGSGIGGSDADKKIRWMMNRSFRLALLSDTGNNTDEMIIDFTRYDVKAREPVSGSSRNWSIMGEINQKQTRSQDKPLPLKKISKEWRAVILKEYPDFTF
jgi:hypothetical protein